MPRTTIFRSSLMTTLALAALVPAASAQDAQQSNRSHTVVRGDTLWDLARRYLGDPFLWPQIYRLNDVPLWKGRHRGRGHRWVGVAGRSQQPGGDPLDHRPGNHLGGLGGAAEQHLPGRVGQVA